MRSPTGCSDRCSFGDPGPHTPLSQLRLGLTTTGAVPYGPPGSPPGQRDPRRTIPGMGSTKETGLLAAYARVPTDEQGLTAQRERPSGGPDHSGVFWFGGHSGAGSAECWPCGGRRRGRGGRRTGHRGRRRRLGAVGCAEELDGVGDDVDEAAALAVRLVHSLSHSLPTTAASRPLLSHSAQLAASLSRQTMSRNWRRR